LHPDTLWELTYAEFQRMAAGYHRRQATDWKRTRWLAAQVFNARRTTEDDPIIQPTDLGLWLPGDPKQDESLVLELSDEEYAAELARLDALD